MCARGHLVGERNGPPGHGICDLPDRGRDRVAEHREVASELVWPVLDQLLAQEVPLGIEGVYDREVPHVLHQHVTVSGVDAYIPSDRGGTDRAPILGGRRQAYSPLGSLPQGDCLATARSHTQTTSAGSGPQCAAPAYATRAPRTGHLKQVAHAYPRLQLHVVADNYATRKHPTVKAWLTKNTRVADDIIRAHRKKTSNTRDWYGTSGSRPERSDEPVWPEVRHAAETGSVRVLSRELDKGAGVAVRDARPIAT